MAKQAASKVPQIRFKGFEGEWEEKELGELADIKLGKMLDKVKHTNGQLLPYLNNISLRWNDVDTSNLPQMHFKDDELERFGLRAGDVVVCEGGEPGRSAIWDGHLPNLKFQKAIHRVRFNVPYEATLLVLHLQNIVGTNRFEMLFTGGGIKHLTREAFALLKVPQPSLQEQRDVTLFLSELDSLIGLHQRKNHKLQALKKAMLQKMFPQPGATTPEIRFKDFSGDWVEKTLAELCDLFTDGDWIESKDQSPSGIRLLQTGNIGINEFIDKADKARWISIDTFERLKCEEVFAGDILISRLPEPAGRACIVPKLLHRVITAVDCTIVRTAKNCDPAFLVQHCSLDSYFETVKDFLGGGTRQRITRSALGKFVVKVPDFEEQKKIGTYFRTLDELISKHATQLQKLQQIKSACLEKMFV